MPQARQASVRTLPAAQKRRHIFDATREVIMRRGYDTATMDEIAAEAGVGKGTLYNFFSSKEDLFLSLVMDGLERIRELVEAEVAPIEDPWERFEVGWRTLMLDIFPQLNQQWAFTYQLWGFLARDVAARERMFAAWQSLYQNREQRIVATITEGQKSGRFNNRTRPASAGAGVARHSPSGTQRTATERGTKLDQVEDWPARTESRKVDFTEPTAEASPESEAAKLIRNVQRSKIGSLSPAWTRCSTHLTRDLIVGDHPTTGGQYRGE